MAPPTSGLSQTLQTLTITKIREIDKQRKKYEAKKQEILSEADSDAENRRDVVAHLLSGVKECIPSATADLELGNIRRWLDQSRYDASIPDEMLKSFEKQLRARFEYQSTKFSLANLYSQLMTEWMDPPSSPPNASENEGSEHDFEVLERQKERLQQLCDKFESVVFEPLETDESEIENYIQNIFSGEDGTNALNGLRKSLKNHGLRMLANKTPFDQDSLNWCIKGLLAEHLLSEEKQNVLRDFLENKLVLGEIADVLNMRFADLESWNWDADEGIRVLPRQQLNGKYRIWMDEDVLQAIFVHYIGVSWCVALKSALTELVNRRPFWRWEQGSPIPPEERNRRSYYNVFPTGEGSANNINWERQNSYVNTFLLSALPSTNEALYAGGGGYDNDNEPDERSSRVKTSSIKQQLLRTLATEVLLHQSLHGEVAVVQSDLQWYATGLSHSTIHTIMKLVGFSEDWLAFFKKFLEAPLNMSPSSGDGSSSGKARTRKRGVPMAHAPEKLIGELILFIMDLAVNKESGMLLYRLHDDLWLCGKPAQCAKAWETMQQFAKVAGLEFNRSKTGSVYLSEGDKVKDQSIASTFPKGPVTVGFLTLDPNTNNWIIDQKQVDAHVAQLQKQLEGCDSVLSWIKTWNSCIGRFFSHTFGEPAFCFGRQHVNSILETHERIQNTLFNGQDGNSSNVTEHLKAMILSRFGVSDVPDAFLYMPEQLGGLGLRNPFVRFFLIRERLANSLLPKDAMHEFLNKEKREYLKAKKDFDRMTDHQRRSRFKALFPAGFSSKTPQPSEQDTFMSMEAWTKWRESTSQSLNETYQQLLSTPSEEALWTPPDVKRELDSLKWDLPELKTLSAEKRWIVDLHAVELMEKCGGLSMVEKSFLPLGVLTMMRSKKVTWQMVL
ncbi:hypothetical protein LSUE1_G007582 [Lachnellula suecica]|uniref:Reverse transcriptase domain-containing protein n=1 Tax=Lachnellula suecica TaxID=602035 RepID=A0A8T9BYX9_9HELO|nr:hypothetical protein LSUE1_G007582 [Lachnellula suecica]